MSTVEVMHELYCKNFTQIWQPILFLDMLKTSICPLHAFSSDLATPLKAVAMTVPTQCKVRTVLCIHSKQQRNVHLF
jgi:hypothetical protein